MFRHKLFGNAAAATLGLAAVLGTNAANAQIELDTDTRGLTFAMETVVTTGALEKDGAKYYLVNAAGDEGNVTAAVGVASTASTDRILIEYQLDGMVFRVAPTLAITGGTPAASSLSYSLIGGGTAKDDMALFSVTGDDFGKDAEAELTAAYAIGAGGRGSITMTATNVDLAALLGADNPAVMNEAGYSGAIKLGKALSETPKAMNALTTVDSSFKKFAGDVSVATVGSFMVSVVGDTAISGSRLLKASDGADVETVTEIVATPDDAMKNYVKFMGDFSFASKVTLETFAQEDATCAATGDDIRVMEGEGDDAVVTDTTSATAIASVATPMFLCISVDSDDEDLRIPETGQYMAMTMYEGLENAALPPEAGSNALGMIARDGTTVHLPYLTTNAKWNQRIYIVNRGPAAEYFMEFNGADDEAGNMATGMLAAMSTTVMMVSDVVTVGEGGSTSGTVTIETQSGYIDVATNQVHRENGASDTVVYDAEN